MNKYLIYIPFTLGLDLYSTYWASRGSINNITELHFLSSVFGKGFTGLTIAFILECLVFLFLIRISIFYTNKKQTTKYKLLKLERRKKTLDVNKIIKLIPIVVFIICTSHIIFSLNNFLLELYLRGSNLKIVNYYIKHVHIENRAYLIHISIMIITAIIIICFTKKEDKETSSICSSS